MGSESKGYGPFRLMFRASANAPAAELRVGEGARKRVGEGARKKGIRKPGNTCPADPRSARPLRCAPEDVLVGIADGFLRSLRSLRSPDPPVAALPPAYAQRSAARPLRMECPPPAPPQLSTGGRRGRECNRAVDRTGAARPARPWRRAVPTSRCAPAAMHVAQARRGPPRPAELAREETEVEEERRPPSIPPEGASYQSPSSRQEPISSRAVPRCS